MLIFKVLLGNESDLKVIVRCCATLTYWPMIQFEITRNCKSRKLVYLKSEEWALGLGACARFGQKLTLSFFFNHCTFSFLMCDLTNFLSKTGGVYQLCNLKMVKKPDLSFIKIYPLFFITIQLILLENRSVLVQHNPDFCRISYFKFFNSVYSSLKESMHVFEIKCKNLDNEKSQQSSGSLILVQLQI